MSALSFLILAALFGGANNPAATACGFPAVTENEPAIQVEIAASEDVFKIPGTFGVQIELSTGAQLAARVQSLGVSQSLLIAGSPMKRVYYSISLQPDGRAALTIRDLRNDPSEVTRFGTCSDIQHLLERAQI